MENLIIDEQIDPQELIFQSDVIIGFASTTLLEAAIAGKWVIVPNFAEANDDKFKQMIPFSKEQKIFCTVNQAKQFTEQIDRGLSGYSIKELPMRARERVFEKYIAPIKGDATKKLCGALSLVILRARQSRSKDMSHDR